MRATLTLNGLICLLFQNGRCPSKRGVGISFGPDVTNKFLEKNDLGNYRKYISELHFRKNSYFKDLCLVENHRSVSNFNPSAVIKTWYPSIFF